MFSSIFCCKQGGNAISNKHKLKPSADYIQSHTGATTYPSKDCQVWKVNYTSIWNNRGYLQSSQDIERTTHRLVKTRATSTTKVMHKARRTVGTAYTARLSVVSKLGTTPRGGANAGPFKSASISSGVSVRDVAMIAMNASWLSRNQREAKTRVVKGR